MEIVRRFAEALDRDHYDLAKQLLQPDATYEADGATIHGAEAILASFRAVSDWGKEHLDALEFTHEIDGNAPLEIVFIDVLHKGGEQLRLEHSIHIGLSPSGLINHLRLERPPEEQQLVAAFFERHGLRRLTIATSDDFVSAVARTVLPVLAKYGLADVSFPQTPRFVGSGPVGDGGFELRRPPASLVARSTTLQASFAWEPREAFIQFDIQRDGVLLTLESLLDAAHTANPGMACRFVELIGSRLEWLAAFLDRRCSLLLSGDEAEFARMSAIEKERDETYNRRFIN